MKKVLSLFALVTALTFAGCMKKKQEEKPKHVKKEHKVKKEHAAKKEVKKCTSCKPKKDMTK